MRALIVEDDPGIARGLHFALTQAGYAADVSGTLSAAWILLLSEAFDVLVLDLGLPDGDGSTLLERLRQRPTQDPQVGTHPLTPVLIMTARDEVPDRIAGLDLGADDYLVKPFDVQELLARLRAIQRRAVGRATPLLVHGELVLDPAARKVRWSGQDVSLSVREFDLLHTLLQVSPRVLSKGQLEASLYPLGEGLESNAIEVHVHHVRRKTHERLIRTVRGVGYCIPPQDPI